MPSIRPFCFLIFLLLLLPLSLAFFHPHGPSFGPFGHPQFQFLRNVSASARRRFFQITASPNDTKTAILANLTEWAESNGVQSAFENAHQNCQRKAEQMHGNVSSWLAGDALELFNELWDVRQNMEITRLAECQQICKLLNASNPHLELVVPLPPDTIPGPPPPACFQHPNRIGGHFGGNTKPNGRGIGNRRNGTTMPTTTTTAAAPLRDDGENGNAEDEAEGKKEEVAAGNEED